jgi:aerobic-type carbon monoxide dehydrogenase small subunit (CoxS/CutS family)
LDGRAVAVARDGVSLLEALREDLGVRSVKDGCSPQGQCGCCTVLIDGAARVACVTPVKRVVGRAVVTADGLVGGGGIGDSLVASFVRHGASQCGFCTPGILCRLAAVGPNPSADQVRTALLAHLCRCTGWLSILEAALDPAHPNPGPPAVEPASASSRRRAAIEGGTPQGGGSEVVLGRGGFADDSAPPECLVAVPDGAGGWSTGETLAEAREAAGKVQGRRSGHDLSYPVDVPPGDWDFTLQTTWVEPGYLEPDASWCEPGGDPAPAAANGGAFGGKTSSPALAAARQLADRYGRPVRVVLAREDVVRMGPKRPPLAAGMRRDGTGNLSIVAGPGLAETIALVAPGLTVSETEVSGPPVSADIRAAGWAEAAVLIAVADALRRGSPVVHVTSPGGAWADAEVVVDEEGWPTGVSVSVGCGEPLDEVVLRSYIYGAVHMGLGWVCSEAIAVGDDGVPEDLTIRSFGILRAKDMPPVSVTLDSAGPPVNGSDAVFAAVAAATWLAQGLPSRWPTRRGGRR